MIETLGAKIRENFGKSKRPGAPVVERCNQVDYKDHVYIQTASHTPPPLAICARCVRLSHRINGHFLCLCGQVPRNFFSHQRFSVGIFPDLGQAKLPMLDPRHENTHLPHHSVHENIIKFKVDSYIIFFLFRH